MFLTGERLREREAEHKCRVGQKFNIYRERHQETNNNRYNFVGRPLSVKAHLDMRKGRPCQLLTFRINLLMHNNLQKKYIHINYIMH